MISLNCETIIKNLKKIFIDEINRGNIANIFGITLIAVFLNNEINYPSICVLDKNNIIFNHCGYLKSKEILLIL